MEKEDSKKPIKKKAAKKRAKTYDKSELKVNGTFLDVIKAAVSPDNKNKK